MREKGGEESEIGKDHGQVHLLCSLGGGTLDVRGW